jgi:uncharacterized Zn-binding protein involved in type VI secretion
MIYKRYHIRLGAKTTAGGAVKTASSLCSLDGVGFALEGDKVDCSACGTEGFIQCIQPRLPDRFNGVEYALSGDLCICNCRPAPKLIADQSAKSQTFLFADEDLTRGEDLATGPAYDEQPRLVAPPIEGLPYCVETADGRIFSGRTGRDGLLPRVATEGEGEYHVYWGDEALHRQGATA